MLAPNWSMNLIGSQVAEVVESRNSKYPVGSHVVAYTGWREMAVIDPDAHYDTYGKVMCVCHWSTISNTCF